MARPLGQQEKGAGAGGAATEATLASVLAKLAEIETAVDDLEGYTDGLETLLTTLGDYTDGIEALIGTTNSTLSTMSGFVDGLEGYLDGVETLLTALADPLVATAQAITAVSRIERVTEGATELTVKHALANIAASTTDGNVVTAVTNKKIIVLAAVVVAGGTATNITFNTKPAGAGSAISPLFANAANGGEILPWNPGGWFKTSESEGLTVTTGTGATTGILVTYAEAE